MFTIQQLIQSYQADSFVTGILTLFQQQPEIEMWGKNWALAGHVSVKVDI